MTDYFGAYNNHKSSEMAVIDEEVKKLRVENNYLEEQIKEKQQELEQAKIDKEEQEEAKRIAEEEEAKKKGGKKGAPAPAKKK
jgi:predicted nuclease with TOPRIM domain